MTCQIYNLRSFLRNLDHQPAPNEMERIRFPFFHPKQKPKILPATEPLPHAATPDTRDRQLRAGHSRSATPRTTRRSRTRWVVPSVLLGPKVGRGWPWGQPFCPGVTHCRPGCHHRRPRSTPTPPTGPLVATPVAVAGWVG
jgi:hypothetical protein